MPGINRRDDEWGGTAANRRRFPTEIVRQVRDAVGPDFIVIYRMSLLDLVEDGQSWDETVDLAKNGATKAPKSNKDLDAALAKGRPYQQGPAKINPTLEAAIHKCMESEPENRFQSITQCLKTISKLKHEDV